MDFPKYKYNQTNLTQATCRSDYVFGIHMCLVWLVLALVNADIFITIVWNANLSKNYLKM